MAGKGSMIARKRSARLLAVQAVYQSIQTEVAPNRLTEEFLNFRNGIDDDGDKMVEVDKPLFRDILSGVTNRWGDLQDMIKPRIKTSQTMEPLLTAILVSGSFEILAHRDIDTPIIINDYMDITSSFFGASEPKLINAILDGIAKEVRG